VAEDVQQAPAATVSQRGERDGDSFIPPMPVMTESKIVASSAAPSAPTAAPAYVGSPVAAPMATAPQSSEKRPSLFDRLTGNAQSRQTAPAVQASAKPAAPVAAPSAATAQPTLAVDNSDRIQTQPSFDDDLDIPAFLRRQAN
jgi:hypothetical protein